MPTMDLSRGCKAETRYRTHCFSCSRIRFLCTVSHVGHVSSIVIESAGTLAWK